jgi:GNAT superfamily N-acetyltransferase
MDKKVEVRTYYLELGSRSQLRPPARERPDLAVVQARIPSPELNRFLYTAVGGDWYWVDRLPWTYDEWLAYLNRPELETWVGSVDGTPAGYYELESRPGGVVEIVYFGLLPRFVGQGLGGALLHRAAARGFEMGASRVSVNTCTLDHPNALAAYLARGFRIVREEVREKVFPWESPGPWPGARGFGERPEPPPAVL